MPKPNKKQPKTTNEKPLKVEGEFLDVFKVVKKNKEEKAKKEKNDSN